MNFVFIEAVSIVMICIDKKVASGQLDYYCSYPYSTGEITLFAIAEPYLSIPTRSCKTVVLLLKISSLIQSWCL